MRPPFSGAGASKPAALTPDIPKADAPARRRRGEEVEEAARDGSGAAPRGARATAAVASFFVPPPSPPPPPLQSASASPTCELTADRCISGGAHARETAAAAARRLWTPAAPSVWPKRALAAASARGSLLVFLSLPPMLLFPLNAPARPPTSMGSPSGVPVPWSATRETPARASSVVEEEGEGEGEEGKASAATAAAAAAAAAVAASAAAERSSAACAGPLGAVRLEDRPSWLTADPTSTAKGGGFEEEEEALERVETRDNRSMPQPSPLP